MFFFLNDLQKKSDDLKDCTIQLTITRITDMMFNKTIYVANINIIHLLVTRKWTPVNKYNQISHFQWIFSCPLDSG